MPEQVTDPASSRTELTGNSRAAEQLFVQPRAAVHKSSGAAVGCNMFCSNRSGRLRRHLFPCLRTDTTAQSARAPRQSRAKLQHAFRTVRAGRCRAMRSAYRWCASLRRRPFISLESRARLRPLAWRIAAISCTHLTLSLLCESIADSGLAVRSKRSVESTKC
jgi:hypothetical protein